MSQKEKMATMIRGIDSQIHTASAGILVAETEKSRQRETERLAQEKKLQETIGLCRESGLSGILEELRDSGVVEGSEIMYFCIKMGEGWWHAGVRFSFDFSNKGDDNGCWVEGILSENGIVEKIEWNGRLSGGGINQIKRNGTIPVVEGDLIKAVSRGMKSCIA